MKHHRVLWGAALSILALLAARGARAGGPPSAEMHSALAGQVPVIEKWAAAPALVAAVRQQNLKGPLPGMDNDRWKLLRRHDPIVKTFEECPAGRILAGRIDAGKGLYAEAFLSAAKGEKVAFAGKTTYYIHQGKPKFDEPFGTGRPWEGPIDFDESTQTYTVQIAVPVLDGGRPIGVLVVGVNVSSL